nr:hypothetical protein [Salinirubrum litoreum]
MSVSLNRERLHRVETVDSFETDGPFDVILDNHGEAVHVHLHLDDDLSRAATLSAGNHYVQRGATKRVHVRARTGDEPIQGKLKVVTGYGSESAYVDVTINPASPQKSPVQVDESLGKPKAAQQSAEAGRSAGTASADADGTETADGGTRQIAVADFLPRRSDLPVLAFGLVAILLAAAVGAVIGGSATVFAVGVVVGAVLSALVFVLR